MTHMDAAIFIFPETCSSRDKSNRYNTVCVMLIRLKNQGYCNLLQAIFLRSNYFKSPYSLFCQLFRLFLKIEWEKKIYFPFFWSLFQKWVCCHKRTLKNNQGTWGKSPYSLFWKICFWKKIAFTNDQSWLDRQPVVARKIVI